MAYKRLRFGSQSPPIPATARRCAEQSDTPKATLVGDAGGQVHFLPLVKLNANRWAALGINLIRNGVQVHQLLLAELGIELNAKRIATCILGMDGLFAALTGRGFYDSLYLFRYGIFRFGVVQVEPAFRPAARRIPTKTGAVAVIG